MRGTGRWVGLVAGLLAACGDSGGGGDGGEGGSDEGAAASIASGSGGRQGTGGGSPATGGSPGASGSVNPDAGGEPAPAPAADCDSVADWEPASEALEDDLFGLLNAERAGAGGCPAGDGGTLAPLMINSLLRCSARLHARDMAARDYFDTTNPDGQDTGERIMSTGYAGTRLAESIGRGQTAAELAVTESVCKYVMDAAYSEVGVAHFAEGDTSFWTIDLGD